MGLFLGIAWFLLLVFIVLEVISLSSELKKERKRKIRSYQILLIVLMSIYAIIGIATKDPISEIVCQLSGLCIPVAIEWVTYIAILGALIWKFILVDMKYDISFLKREGKEITERLGKVEGNIEIIKNTTDRLLEFSLRKK